MRWNCLLLICLLAPALTSAEPNIAEPNIGDPWSRVKQQYSQSNIKSSTRPEFIDTQARCLPVGPIRPTFWREYEGSHLFRIVPLDARPHGDDPSVYARHRAHTKQGSYEQWEEARHEGERNVADSIVEGTR
jgi:hypothetical protein